MKKTKTVKVAATEEHTKTVTSFYCDICDESLGQTLYRKLVCDICERHCHNNWKCGSDHPEDHGDYPRTLCRICLDLYNNLILPLRTEFENTEESMLIRIRKESLEK